MHHSTFPPILLPHKHPSDHLTAMLINVGDVVFLVLYKGESSYVVLLRSCSRDTGCSVWKQSEKNGCSTEKLHILPNVGKAKTRLRGGSFFYFQKFGYIFSCMIILFQQKPYTDSQTHFGFSNIGSNMHCFSAKVTSFWLFPMEHPVLPKQNHMIPLQVERSFCTVLKTPHHQYIWAWLYVL